MTRQTRLVYGSLLLAWLTIAIWQTAEHARVRRIAREALVNHARDVSTTVGLVMRSQRRFGIISKERMESALAALVKPDELNAIALLNDAGEVVASAGAPIDYDVKGLVPRGAHWGRDTVTLVNLVDLGTNVTAEAEGPRPTLVLPRGAFGTNRPGPPGPPTEDRPNGPPNADEARPPGPPAGDQPPTPPADANGPPAPNPASDRPRFGPGGGRPPFGRPFWMSEAEYRAAIEKQGVHSFVVVLSARPYRAAIGADLWLRGLVGLLATVAVGGLGMAWRAMVRSSELEVRLARAAELNARLKEMNLAAAGLAHETKNPLNIIRGLAQMISQLDAAPADVRDKSRSIVHEADRVTAQLNEFINYSRPREVRRAAVSLSAVVQEVVRTLAFDLEEKEVQLTVPPDLPRVIADEQLLRQALFNLFLNAIQALERGGEITVVAARDPARGVTLEIRDNGPGVPAEHRQDIFKPYFTTNQRGTGLGLAVVHQIVLAHGWDIECLANEPRGAVFRLSQIQPAPAA
ncbi:MAG: hypothetical protein IPM17_06010 [Verrucomicrobia bacterium]|nr:hypothetical protein [Verrucomicrobiota bacterium]